MNRKKFEAEQQLRLDGFYRAYEIAKRDGIKALEKEVRFRKATAIPVNLDMNMCQQIINSSADKLNDMFKIIVLHVLNRKFGFGEIRLKRFLNEVYDLYHEVDRMDPYGYKMISYFDMYDFLKEKYHIDLNEEYYKSLDAGADEYNRGMKYHMAITTFYSWLNGEGYIDAAEDLKEYFKEAFDESEVD